jgi:hypothetical protein
MPEIFTRVVLIDSLSEIFRLANINQRLCRLFRLSKKEVQGHVVEFRSRLRSDPIASWDRDSLYDPRCNFRNPDSPRFPSREEDLDCLTFRLKFHRLQFRECL